jgi:outer membrane lipoprotein-sorting protein
MFAVRTHTAIILGLAAGLVSLGQAQVAQGQTAEELIAKNLKAKGGVERLKAVQGMRISGRVTLPNAQGGMEIPMTIITKRPNRFRQESTVQGKKVVAAFDGTRAWMINPMTGSDAPSEIKGGPLDMVRQQADLDGPLVDYKAKGTTVETAGTDVVDGKKVYKLKVTPKTGPVVTLFLDAETGLESKTVMDVGQEDGAPAGAQPMPALESIFSNYQNVEGLMMPHTIQQKIGGQVIQINIDKVELSPAVDDSVFAMPAPAAAGAR